MNWTTRGVFCQTQCIPVVWAINKSIKGGGLLHFLPMAKGCACDTWPMSAAIFDFPLAWSVRPNRAGQCIRSYVESHRRWFIYLQMLQRSKNPSSSPLHYLRYTAIHHQHSRHKMNIKRTSKDASTMILQRPTTMILQRPTTMIRPPWYLRVSGDTITKAMTMTIIAIEYRRVLSRTIISTWFRRPRYLISSFEKWWR